MTLPNPDVPPPDSIRLDVWLDVACLYKTRSDAQKACKSGKVEVNGQSSKPHRLVRPGDRLVLTRPMGRKQTVVV
ncbi:MAG TPA: S4 domain-containing protein, partial [Vicinamibacterales bacterium]|nr:S4 domain-containing protein [Vicinamibacterales bacterium]